MGWDRPLIHFIDALVAVAVFVLHLAVAARAITRPGRIPSSRVAWVAVIMALPLVGVIAYLMVGETSIGRERVRRLHQTIAAMPIPRQDADPDVPPRVRGLFDLVSRINGFEPTTGNTIRLLGDADAPIDQPMIDSDLAINALIADVESATDSVHISFYIWLDDDHGGLVADAVCAAAKRGVRCRVMVDALGSRAFTKSPRWRQLADAGVETFATLGDIPRLGNLAVGRVDLRDHRKIVIIDNAIAYCGSQNCADPQFRVEAKYAPWVDILFRCEGPIVRQAQYIFLSTWITGTGHQELEAVPSAAPLPAPRQGGAVAQMFGTGPTSDDDAMSDAFVTSIYAARAELLITTPYFVPDESLLRALAAAPRRGVRTRLILPARNNSWLVAASARSTYAALLESGVEILEYPLGLLHTKAITADGEFALVGSANMDRRSLQLNFENNLLIADPDVVAQIRRRQEGYAAASHPVSEETVLAWPWRRRFVQNAVDMVAPLL